MNEKLNRRDFVRATALGIVLLLPGRRPQTGIFSGRLPAGEGGLFFPLAPAAGSVAKWTAARISSLRPAGAPHFSERRAEQ